MPPEVWLRGPVAGVPPLLMPAAHVLLQVQEDLHAAVEDLTPAELWHRPNSAAAIGFHIRHLGGSLGRLCTYAQGRKLDPVQYAAIATEGEPGSPAAPVEEVLAGLDVAIADGLEVLRSTSEEELLAPRAVGRAALPSNVLGLLFHAAEHAQRHTGQVIATAKIVRGLGLG